MLDDFFISARPFKIGRGADNFLMALFASVSVMGSYSYGLLAALTRLLYFVVLGLAVIFYKQFL